MKKPHWSPILVATLALVLGATVSPNALVRADRVIKENSRRCQESIEFWVLSIARRNLWLRNHFTNGLAVMMELRPLPTTCYRAYKRIRSWADFGKIVATMELLERSSY